MQSVSTSDLKLFSCRGGLAGQVPSETHALHVILLPVNVHRVVISIFYGDVSVFSNLISQSVLFAKNARKVVVAVLQSTL